MLKKMMLLAMAVGALVAFAVPASASAFEWTDNGSAFTGTASDTLSGFIAFGSPEPEQTKFGCVSHAGLSVTGGSSTGTLTSFTPTTATCKGEGTFEGCELESDSSTIPAGTTTTIVGTEEVTLTTPAGQPIVIHNVYASPCPIEKVTVTVEHLRITSSDSTLTHVSVAGLATADITLRSPTIEFAETVGVFGTLGTETDTISIS